MAADPRVALIDACVLAGALQRNMVLSLAEAGFFRPCWSREIIGETEAAIASILLERGDAEARTKARRHCDAIRRAFSEAEVVGHRTLIETLDLPDPGDRHVLAAAIHSGASAIVTDNIRHFPKEYLRAFHLGVSTADEFLADLIDLDAPVAVAALRRMRQRFRRPELDAAGLLTRMQVAGLTRTATLLAGEAGSL